MVIQITVILQQRSKLQNGFVTDTIGKTKVIPESYCRAVKAPGRVANFMAKYARGLDLVCRKPGDHG